jgi:16S rRNA (cytosine1402-N4)-methyltransferase
MNKQTDHVPILLEEVLHNIDSSNYVIDATLGRGGHFMQILQKCNVLVGLDYDKASIDYVSGQLIDKGYTNVKNEYQLGEKQVALLNIDFSQIDKVFSKYGTPSTIIADLGVSTYQIKDSVEGMSFLKPSDGLDMRISSEKKVKASDLLNMLSEKELTSLFKNLAQVPHANDLAKKIVVYRKEKPFVTVGDFLQVGNFKKSLKGIHEATQPFMALRIAVNGEHLSLNSLLKNSIEPVNRGCTLMVITFHSLEERKIKIFINKNNFKFKKLEPTKEEVLKNKSSRSAKLYIVKNGNK